jgi:proline iminopeptidase
MVFLIARLATAQMPPFAQGTVHTPDVDLSYLIYGAPSATTPMIVVNGGPGFDHRYMVGNDVWDNLAKKRQVVFYDQRGLGKSKLLNPKAEQTIPSTLKSSCSSTLPMPTGIKAFFCSKRSFQM